MMSNRVLNLFVGYRIIISKSAQKDLKRLPKSISREIIKKLHLLVTTNGAFDVRKMEGENHPTYRLRHRVYRVVFRVYKEKITLLVVTADHRKDVYRKKGR